MYDLQRDANEIKGKARILTAKVVANLDSMDLIILTKQVWHMLKKILPMDLIRRDTDEIHIGAL